jgi:hypothetical protein
VSTIVMTLVDRPWLMSGSLFLLLVLLIELGHRMGLAARGNKDVPEPLEATRDSLSLLLSLLLGFTLAMALPRYEDRKKLIVDEANAIGTTALRADMLPEPSRSKVLQILPQYVDARMKFSIAPARGEPLQQALAKGKELQNQMWRESVSAAQQSPSAITSIFVQTLNDMIDLSEKRQAMLENRVPAAVWVLLVMMSCLSCLAIGAAAPRRFWFVMLVSPLTIAIVIGLVADLDAPRSGLIRASQQSLRRVQNDLQSGSDLHLENSPRKSP